MKQYRLSHLCKLSTEFEVVQSLNLEKNIDFASPVVFLK